MIDSLTSIVPSGVTNSIDAIGAGVLVAGIAVGVKLSIEIFEKVYSAVKRDEKKSGGDSDVASEVFKAMHNSRCPSHDELTGNVAESLSLQRMVHQTVTDMSARTDKNFDETFDRLRDLESRVGTVEGEVKVLVSRGVK